MPPWLYTFLTSGRNPSRYSCSPPRSFLSLAKMIMFLHHQRASAGASYATCSHVDGWVEGFSLQHDDDDDARKNHTHYDNNNNGTSCYHTEDSTACDDNLNANVNGRNSGLVCKHCLVDDDPASNDELRLQALANNGQLDKALALLSCFVSSPSDASYLSLLRACSRSKALAQTKQIHKHIGLHRSQLTGLLGDYLAVTMATCGAAEDAYELATTLSCRTVFSWSAIITAYADSDRGQEALQMLQQMQEEGIEPNNYTFVGLLKACASLSDLEKGRKLHSDTCKNGYAFDSFVGNTLVSMYAKCGAVLEAENVFGSLTQRDVVSWNAMVSTYVEEGDGVKALQLYEQMHKEGVHFDAHTFAIALQACTNLTEKGECLAFPKETIKGLCLEIGQALHADMRKMKNILSDVVIGNTLVSMYCKCSNISQAEGVFAMLRKRDVVSWNAMLSAYVEHYQAEKCLQLYNTMREEGEIPDQLTIVFALQACGILAEKEEAVMAERQTNKEISLKVGQALHTDICRNGFASDVIICNALVTMYGKCGTLVETEDMFSVLSFRDTVSWNALLSAYVEQGCGDKALQLYKHMQKQQVTVDDLTLVCILQACSETGSVALCMQLHFDIASAGYDGMSSVVTTLIHSYGNCASVVDGRALFDNLKEADVITWNALIASYAGNGQCLSSLCTHEQAKLAGIRPVAVSFTSALLACCHRGLVYEGVQYFISMLRDNGIMANLKHWNILIDLMGRAGMFKHVEEMLLNMPMQADLTMWLSLLGACRTHGNIALARCVFAQVIKLHPKHPTAYVMMSNIYTDAGLHDSAAEVEISRQRQHAWKRPGQFWDGHGQELEFRHEKLPQGMFLTHMLHQ